MKRINFVLTALFFATALLSLAAVASAQDNHPCSNALLAGTWGYTKTGTIYLPTGAALFASIGTLTFDAAGNVSGTLEASLGGTIGKSELAGTFTMNSNCSGTMAFGVYDQSGNLLRTVTMALVLDDKARELRGLMTSLVLPNGMSLPTVITGNARRLFPNQGDQQ